MGYDGRPSRGCGTCRVRKVRCDQTRPACNECTRLNKECPGYREEWAIVFRDESEYVKQKARIPRSSSSGSIRPRRGRPRLRERNIPSSSTGESSKSYEGTILDFGSDSGHQFLIQQARQSPIRTHPDPSVSKQEAICFFLRSHTIPGSSFLEDSLATFLIRSGGSPGQQAIYSSIVAVSTAMLSRVRKARSLRPTAGLEYGIALKRVNEALAHPDEAKTNQTLGAVILLSLYEIVVSRRPQHIQGWTNHISGAAALLEYRGFEQLRTEAGVRLFLHLRYQIIISCLQRDVRVPSFLLESSKLDLFPQVKEALGNKLVLIIGKLSNLRADIMTKDVDDPQKILDAACAIEADLNTWLVSLPPEFTYSSHTLMPLDHDFERRCSGIRPLNNEYHQYPEIWSANCWNHYRCARILVSEIILAQAHSLSNTSSCFLSEDFRLHCKSLRSTIRRLSADICRSVPFHFGALNSFLIPDAPVLPSESYIGGLMLFWPLWVAGVVEGPAHPQRQWVVHCLQTIGHSWGMDQALAVMDILRVDPGMFHSAEKYGDAADPPPEVADTLPFSVFHVPYYDLQALKEYQSMCASSGAKDPV